jgi:CRISPR-associated protein Csd1
MILKALYDMAVSDGLVRDPDYQVKPVSWLLRVRRDGQFAIEDLRSGKGMRGRQTRVPRLRSRTSNDLPCFLYDNSSYVFGVESAPKKDLGGSRLARRREMFLAEAERCLAATGDAGVRAVVEALRRMPDGIPAGCAECKSNDLFAFAFEDDDHVVTDRPAIAAHWRALRASGVAAATGRTCIVTGEAFGGECVKFPLLMNVPGGLSSGASLVGFNIASSESHGWKFNENATISKKAAEGCATALNRLLHPAPPDPENPGRVLPRRNVRLGDSLVVCYWSRPAGLDGSLAGLLDGDPEKVGDVYKSLWRGEAPPDVDDSRFYALTLAGAEGRVAIKDWFEFSVGKAQANLAAHFRDLECARRLRPARGEGPSPVVPLRFLVESLSAGTHANMGRGIPRSRSDHNDGLAASLVKSALSGAAYPAAIVPLAVGRYRAGIRMENDAKDGWITMAYQDARAALVRATLNRRARLAATQNHTEIKPDMDPANSDKGYVLGQMMAVLERLQLAAIGDVNASVVDRCFGAASASPGVVFPRLLRLARHHARKISGGERGGLAVLMERLLDDMAGKVGAAFPQCLSLEQQGQFVLGYHHARKWLWMGKAERWQWQQRNPDAPKAYVWLAEEPAD